MSEWISNSAIDALAEFPESGRALALKDQLVALEQFVEWLGVTHGICLAYRRSNDFQPLTPDQVDDLIHQHFGIDLVALDAEQRVMTERLRVLFSSTQPDRPPTGR